MVLVVDADRRKSNKQDPPAAQNQLPRYGVYHMLVSALPSIAPRLDMLRNGTMEAHHLDCNTMPRSSCCFTASCSSMPATTLSGRFCRELGVTYFRKLKVVITCSWLYPYVPLSPNGDCFENWKVWTYLRCRLLMEGLSQKPRRPRSCYDVFAAQVRPWCGRQHFAADVNERGRMPTPLQLSPCLVSLIWSGKLGYVENGHNPRPDQTRPD